MRPALAIPIFAALTAALGTLDAPQARAQTADVEALERSLEALYVPEPTDVEAAAAGLEALRLRRSRDFKVEAGLAMAYAALAAQSGDQGLLEKAARSVERAMRLNPENRIAQRADGLVALVAGRLARRPRDREEQLAKAAHAFELAAKRESPKRWLDLTNLGIALAEAGATERAVGELRSAALVLRSEFEPDGMPLWAAAVQVALGRTLARRGDLGEALAAFRAARAARPGDPALAAESALLRARAGEVRAALAELEDALPKLALGSSERREAALGVARLRVALGEPGGALALLAAEIATATAAPETIALRGELARLSGGGPGAEADFREALWKDGFTALAHAGLAELALARGATATALASARTAAALEPRSPARLRLLARALRAAGETGGAEKVAADRIAPLERSLAEAARAGRELPSETARREAEALLASGRTEEALEAASRLEKLDPEDATVLILRARALAGSAPHEAAGAQAAAAALVARFPDVHEAHALAAAAAELAGDDVAARAAAERALGLEPRSTTANRVLATLTGAAPASLTGGAGAPAAELPAALASPARRLSSPDPIERARAAAELIADPAGASLTLRHIERESDPYVVGAIAVALADRGVEGAAPTLRRLLKTIPSSQMVVRARVRRALIRLGDEGAIDEVLGAALAGDSAGGDGGGAEGVIALVCRLDDVASVRFQRGLVESPSEIHRALGPALARHLTEEALAGEKAEEARAGSLLRMIRIGLAAALVGLALLRYRLYRKQEKLRKLAEAAKAHRAAGSWDSVMGG